MLLERVLTCWIKLSCLFEVVAQKSSRSTVSFSFETLPFSATMVVLLFLPKGGLVRIMSKRSPGSAARESLTANGKALSSSPIPCSIKFMAQSRAVDCTSSQPLKVPCLSFFAHPWSCEDNWQPDCHGQRVGIHQYHKPDRKLSHPVAAQ